MSVPHVRGPVTRKSAVTIQYQNLEGVVNDFTATGFLARVINHEIDHLNGILYIDRMDSPSQLEKTDIFK